LLNGVFTFVIISLSIIYYHQFAWSKQVKPELVFWTGIIASFIVSIFVWLSTASPSAGTSIIGFCMVGFLLFTSLSDLRIYFNKKIIEQGKLIIAKVFLTASITVISLFFVFFFYSLSSSVYVHFGGGAIAAILILITIKTKI